MICRFCREPIRFDGHGAWVDATNGDGCCGDDEGFNENDPHSPEIDLRFVACPGCHKIDETEIATDGSVCCPACGLRYNPTHPSSQPQPTSFGFGGHASKENK